MEIHGSDEVYALVFDIGTSTTKVGFAGEDHPTAVVPSYVGVLSSEENTDFMDLRDDDEPDDSSMTNVTSSSKKYFVGRRKLSFVRDFMDLESPFDENGMLSRWDHVERLLAHSQKDRLGVQSSQHPLVMAELPFIDRHTREKMAEIVFETFNHPAYYTVKSPVLSSFSAGKSSVLVLQSGAGHTIATPVLDGYVLQRGISRTNFAGDWLSNQILSHYVNQKIPIRPRFMFQKRTNPMTNMVQHVQSRDTSNVKPSYVNWSTRGVIEDIKSEKFFVSENPVMMNLPMNLKPTSFELPDGSVINAGDERVKLLEYFFQPSALSQGSSNSFNIFTQQQQQLERQRQQEQLLKQQQQQQQQGNNPQQQEQQPQGVPPTFIGNPTQPQSQQQPQKQMPQQQQQQQMPSSLLPQQPQLQQPQLPTQRGGYMISNSLDYARCDIKGMHNLVNDAIEKCEPDLRKLMYNQIVISGGNTLFPGFMKRFEREMIAKTPVAVRSGKSPLVATLDRIYSVWMGGSILASLGSFQQMWISNEQFKENGPNIINKCCP